MGRKDDLVLEDLLLRNIRNKGRSGRHGLSHGPYIFPEFVNDIGPFSRVQE